MEDRPPGEPGGLLEAAYRRALVAVAGEAGAGRRQDLVATCVELILTHPGHDVDRVTVHRNAAIRTYGLAVSGATGASPAARVLALH